MSILLHSKAQRQAQRQYVVDVMSQFDEKSRFFADDIRLRNDCEVRIRHDFTEKSNPSRIETYSEWMEMAEDNLSLATMRDVHIEKFYPKRIEGVNPIYQRTPRIAVFLTLKFLFPVSRCSCGEWDHDDGLYDNCWICHREADEAFQARMEAMATTPDELDFVKAVLARGAVQHG